jgi:hypothetical protein
MTQSDNIYDKIRELLGNVNGQLSILENQIDLKIQKEYFNYSKKVNLNLNHQEVIKNKDEIFKAGISIEDQKDMLVKLASVNDIEAYRTIEKYIQGPHPVLKDWAILALKESRMLIESKMLDENQILISTGLGGKGMKLRYFTAFIAMGEKSYNSLQQKIIRKEAIYFIKKAGGELEEILFDNEICSLISIIPLKIAVHTLFKNIINECNLLGKFINPNYVITNVKIISAEDIRAFLRK